MLLREPAGTPRVAARSVNLAGKRDNLRARGGEILRKPVATRAPLRAEVEPRHVGGRARRRARCDGGRDHHEARVVLLALEHVVHGLELGNDPRAVGGPARRRPRHRKLGGRCRQRRAQLGVLGNHRERSTVRGGGTAADAAVVESMRLGGGGFRGLGARGGGIALSCEPFAFAFGPLDLALDLTQLSDLFAKDLLVVGKISAALLELGTERGQFQTKSAEVVEVRCGRGVSQLANQSVAHVSLLKYIYIGTKPATLLRNRPVLWVLRILLAADGRVWRAATACTSVAADAAPATSAAAGSADAR
jgi:hypothetical protein